jgi:hypothetical protein
MLVFAKNVCVHVDRLRLSARSGVAKECALRVVKFKVVLKVLRDWTIQWNVVHKIRSLVSSWAPSQTCPPWSLA